MQELFAAALHSAIFFRRSPVTSRYRPSPIPFRLVAEAGRLVGNRLTREWIGGVITLHHLRIATPSPPVAAKTVTTSTLRPAGTTPTFGTNPGVGAVSTRLLKAAGHGQNQPCQR